jgi:hypothetical protein
MFLRITPGHFDPARYDDVVQLSRQADAAIHALPGCQTIRTGLSRTTGRLAIVSTWETAHDKQWNKKPD